MPPLLPTTLLPLLPRRNPTSLSPLTSQALLIVLDQLESVLIPEVRGTTSTKADVNKKERGRSGSRSSRGSQDSQGQGQGQPRIVGQDCNASIDEEQTETEQETDSAIAHPEDDDEELVVDEFEREYASTWLSSLLRRGEPWISEIETPLEELVGEEGYDSSGELSLDLELLEGLGLGIEEQVEVKKLVKELKKREEVLKRASGLIALMAGCSATGSITRTLRFPLPLGFNNSRSKDKGEKKGTTCSHSSVPGMDQGIVSPKPIRLPLPIPVSIGEGLHSLPDTPDLTRCSTPFPSAPITRLPTPSPTSENDDEQQLVDSNEIKMYIHDAALDTTDHLSVGVQTWGSSILMGRIISEDCEEFYGSGSRGRSRGRSESKDEDEDRLVDREVDLGDEDIGPRVLELGAGTGVLSILSRLILDRLQPPPSQRNTNQNQEHTKQDQLQSYGKVIATDYHPLVMDNLKKCVELNYPDSVGSEDGVQGLKVIPLDWMTFPGMAAEHHQQSINGTGSTTTALTTNAPNSLLDEELTQPFDIIFAADCVYDVAHAGLIRDCCEWLMRVPEEGVEGDEGGVMYLLSPIRPTYGAETASIARAFPFSTSSTSYIPPTEPDVDGLTALASSSPTSKYRPFAPDGVSRILKTPTTSGIATPVLSELEEDSKVIPPARAKGWKLVTKKRKELERMKGSGRADEVLYWLWEVRWERESEI